MGAPTIPASLPPTFCLIHSLGRLFGDWLSVGILRPTVKLTHLWYLPVLPLDWHPEACQGARALLTATEGSGLLFCCLLTLHQMPTFSWREQDKHPTGASAISLGCAEGRQFQTRVLWRDRVKLRSICIYSWAYTERYTEKSMLIWESVSLSSFLLSLVEEQMHNMCPPSLTPL